VRGAGGASGPAQPRPMTYAIEAEGLTKRFGKTQASPASTVAAREGTFSCPRTERRRQDHRRPNPRDAAAGRLGHGDRRRVRRGPRAQQVRQNVGLTGQYASVDEDLTAPRTWC